MKDTRLKIASLNLWRFHDWNTRLPLIISTLEKINPDIILFQEIQKDISFDTRNQIDILNSYLKYPHSHFSVADIKTTRKGLPLPYPVDHGLGILSKFPFNSRVIKLTRAQDDKENRILQINTLHIDGTIHCFTNVHFSNFDPFAEAHLKESLDILKDKNSAIIGDFNIKDIKKNTDFYTDTYICSSDFAKYISYPKDNVSYDYMLLPKSYVFESFDCIDDKISDHRMIVATIILPTTNL